MVGETVNSKRCQVLGQARLGVGHVTYELSYNRCASHARSLIPLHKAEYSMALFRSVCSVEKFIHLDR